MLNTLYCTITGSPTEPIPLKPKQTMMDDLVGSLYDTVTKKMDEIEISPEKTTVLKENVNKLVSAVGTHIIDYANDKLTNFTESTLNGSKTSNTSVSNEIESKPLLSQFTEKEFGGKEENFVPEQKVFKHDKKIILEKMKNKNVSLAEKLDIMSDVAQYMEKTEITILVIGNTQSGKSSTIKNLLNLDESVIEIGNGRKSCTSKINKHTYKRNNITINAYDTPGFYDTDGRSQEFYTDLINHIKKCDQNDDTKIDVVLWIAKVDEVIAEYTKNMIDKLSRDIGTNFWEKTMVILTHINTIVPPECYIKMAELKFGVTNDEDYNPELEKKIDIYAWKLFIGYKKIDWIEALNKYNPNINIVFVENNKRFNGASKGDHISRLLDGTKIIETFYLKLFKLIEILKTPAMFTFLVGKISRDSISLESDYEDWNNSFTQKGSEYSDQYELHDIDFYTQKNSVETPSMSPIAHSSQQHHVDLVINDRPRQPQPIMPLMMNFPQQAQPIEVVLPRKRTKKRNSMTEHQIALTTIAPTITDHVVKEVKKEFKKDFCDAVVEWFEEKCNIF